MLELAGSILRISLADNLLRLIVVMALVGSAIVWMAAARKATQAPPGVFLLGAGLTLLGAYMVWAGCACPP